MDGPVLAVSLVNGTTVVDGDQLAVVNATTLTCEFDLDSAPVGMYKIRVTTGCGTTATSVDDLFTVDMSRLDAIVDRSSNRRLQHDRESDNPVG